MSGRLLLAIFGLWVGLAFKLSRFIGNEPLTVDGNDADCNAVSHTAAAADHRRDHRCGSVQGASERYAVQTVDEPHITNRRLVYERRGADQFAEGTALKIRIDPTVFRDAEMNQVLVSHHTVHATGGWPVRVLGISEINSALSKLDPTLTIDRPVVLFEASSNVVPASNERLLDSLLRFFLGADTGPLPYADASDSAPERVTFHNTLRQLQEESRFQALAGQVRVEPTHDASAARDDFAALLSLTSGATFSLRLNDPSPASPASLALYGGNRAAYEQWLADRNLAPAQRDAGQANFSDAYLRDRADMLNWLAQGNTRDIGNLPNGSQITGVPVSRLVLYQDITQNTTFTVSTHGLSAQSPTVNRVIFGSTASTRLQFFAQSLTGEGRIDFGGKDTGAKARNDFSAMDSLVARSPVVLTGTDSANAAAFQSTLQGVWGRVVNDAAWKIAA
jgi:hypothetical protein